MSPNDIASLTGAAIAGAASTGAVFVRFALPWFRRRDNDFAAIRTEVGVGTVGPSIVELVAGTANAVHRLEQNSMKTGEGISEVLRVQKEHGGRITSIENKHEALDARVTLALHTERIAELLAAKTEEIAATLATKTDRAVLHTADQLRDAFAAHDLLKTKKRPKVK